MPTARRGLVAGTINGVIYAAGGADSSGTPLGTLEAYDVASNTWSARAPMPTPRTGVAGGVIDGRLYVAGGSTATSSVSTTLEVYDPATNTWTAKAPLPGAIGGGRRRRWRTVCST
jgi:N-acetylneuraminic acid mutarotase